MASKYRSAVPMTWKEDHAILNTPTMVGDNSRDHGPWIAGCVAERGIRRISQCGAEKLTGGKDCGGYGGPVAGKAREVKSWVE